MGASKSKSVEDKAALSKVVDHPIQTSDVSTGFHILEIHMSLVGMGWMSLLLLLGGAVLIYALWRKFHGQGTARVSQHQLHQPWIGYPGPMGHPRREFDFFAPERGFPPTNRFDNDRFYELAQPRGQTPLFSSTAMVSGPAAPQPPPVAMEPTSPRATTIDSATC